MTEDELAVLSANDAFYRAFAEQSYPDMNRLWASEQTVSCIHPGWSPLIGRDPVMKSWHAILRAESFPVEPYAPRAFVVGDSAYVLCFEGLRGRPPMLAATNVFMREDGAWKIVHHHAGQLSQPPEPVASGPTN